MQKLAGEISEQELHERLAPLVKQAAPKPLFSTVRNWFSTKVNKAKAAATPKAMYTTLGIGGLGLLGGGILGNRRYQEGIFQDQASKGRILPSQQAAYRPLPQYGAFPQQPEGVPPVPALPGYWPTGMIDPRISTNNIQ